MKVGALNEVSLTLEKLMNAFEELKVKAALSSWFTSGWRHE